MTPILSRILAGCLIGGCLALTAACSSDETHKTQAASTPTAAGVVGHFRYMADAARFQACGDDVEYPVATEGDNARLERAYLETATLPAEKLLVRFEGNLTWQPKFDPTTGQAGEKERAWYVERFVGMEVEGRCP